MTPTAAGDLAAFLARPDAVLAPDASPSPRRLAVRTAAGLAGASLFVLTFGVGLAFGEGLAADPDVAARLLRLAAVPPVAALLAFPPLVLVTALRGRSVGLLRLAGVAVGGATTAGLWLGAAAPVLLLYALTGEIDAAFVVLTVGIALVSVVAGAVGAVCNARRAGEGSPGPLVALAHYALFGWTALILTAHVF